MLRVRLFWPIFFFSLLSSIPPALAGPSQRWGLAGVLGEPVGLSAKFWVSERWAADFGIGYSWTSQARVWTDVDYHLPLPHPSKDISIKLIIGLGVRFFFSAGTFVATGVGSGIGVGARVPLGIEARIAQSPLHFGVFLSPGIGILPQWAFAPEGALTLRWVLESQ